MLNSGRSKALAGTVLCCRTTYHCLSCGRNRAWKLGLKPWTRIYGCYLPQADPWGSHVVPYGVAYVSCQANEGPQSWTEHLGSAAAASASHWTVPSWLSLELGSIMLAGGFWMPNQTLLLYAHSFSWKKGKASCLVQQNWTFRLENLSLLANKMCPQDFFLHSSLYIISMCC